MMPTPIRLGLVLGLVFAAYSTLVAVAGWYTNVVVSFWLLLALELAGACWALSRTARGGRGYLRQVLVGAAMFAVAAGVLFVQSYVTLRWVIPDYADVIVAAARERAVASANPPADLEARLVELHGMYRPILQATYVVPATIVTGLVFSSLAAIVFRARRPRRPEASAGAAMT